MRLLASIFSARSLAVLLTGVCFSECLLAETVLLSEATVHTVSGETLPVGFVLIENGKIKTVAGMGADLSADKVIDLKGLHLYPGMIALDTSLGLTEVGAVR